MIIGIHHLKLPVTDVMRSRAWYEQVLGFHSDIEFVERGELVGVSLAHDGCPSQLALRRDPERARALAGFDAVAFLIGSREEVRDRAAALTASGHSHGGVVAGHRGGAVLIGLHDPDGIEIRLYAD